MKTMTARFPGRCRNCGATITPGDRIRYSKPTGALCANRADCEDFQDAQAEQRAEMRAEAWMEARFTGTTDTFWENQDYARDHDNAEYARGYHETRLAQMAGPAGSAAREAAYMEMELAAYNRGDDY